MKSLPRQLPQRVVHRARVARSVNEPWHRNHEWQTGVRQRHGDFIVREALS